MAANNCLNIGAVAERIQHGQEAFARYRKYPITAL